ncbi:MAG: ABC transporter permease [Eisenbergiella massiliensis]|uniref:ABC transporter permease n=1 Tax=Eisenbergiella massiliensis TaxID=1720294 RepID=UPI0039916BDA
MKTKSIRASFALFKITTAENLQYRASAFSSAIMCIFYALIDITVFSVFFKYGSNQGSDMALTLPQMASFIWLKQIMLPPYGIYPEFRAKIETGDIGLELCRPWDLYTHWMARLTAWRVGSIWWRSLIIIVIAFLLPIPYRLGAPVSLPYFVFFVLSTISAFFFWAAYHMLVTSVRIGITWGEGPCILMLLVSDILSGVYFPLQLWPDSLQKFLLFQPFAGSFDLPLRFYVGSVPIDQSLQMILLQVGWSIVFVILGRLIMKHKLNNLIVQGG